MAAFIELQADGFQSVLSDVSDKGFDFVGVRRPFRGYEIKEDTYCVMKVIRSNGREVPLVDAGSKITKKSHAIRSETRKSRDGSESQQYLVEPSEGMTFNYSNFIAQAIVEARSEKSQIVETFGEPYIFFFGEKPRILNVQGLLMNTLDFNWKNEFWKNYEHYLRGTRLVELDARVYLYYDDQIVEGYILDAQASHDSGLPYHVPFNFTVFVTAHTFLGAIDSSGLYPISTQVVDVTSDDLRSVDLLDRTLKKLRDRRDKLRPNKLISTIEEVALESEKAAGGVIGLKAIQQAIVRGLSDYEARTNAFLSNVKTYFYGRRTVVPRGIAGSERFAGEAQYANEATFLAPSPKRKLALRSKISDNVDEYVGAGGDGAALAADLMAEAMQSQQNLDWDTYEAKLLSNLAAMGVDTTEPTLAQTMRSRVTNAIVEASGKVDFAAGIAIHGTGSLMHKAKQLVSSLPSPVQPPTS